MSNVQSYNLVLHDSEIIQKIYHPIDHNAFRFPTTTDGDWKQPQMILSRAGTLQLRYRGHTFNKHVSRGQKVYWRCSQHLVYRCKVRIQTMVDDFTVSKNDHNHPVVAKQRPYGSLKQLKQQMNIG